MVWGTFDLFDRPILAGRRRQWFGKVKMDRGPRLGPSVGVARKLCLAHS